MPASSPRHSSPSSAQLWPHHPATIAPPPRYLPRTTALARLEEAASENKERPDERARGLDALANELEAALAHTPADVAADLGLSSNLIADLRHNAKAVLGARSSAKESRGDVSSLYGVMNILDGRVLFELRTLLGALRDARKNDPSVPSIKAGRLQDSGKPAKTPLPLAGSSPMPDLSNS